MSKRLAPFGPESLTGFELELVGPPEASRSALAQRLAAVFDLSITYVFVPNVANGGEIFELVPGFRLSDDQGQWRLTLADDFSITHDLNDTRETAAGRFRLLSREQPVASYVARKVQSALSHEDAFQQFVTAWGLELGAEGEQTDADGERLLFDPEGEVALARGLYHRDRERVVEVISAPLPRASRIDTLASWLEVIGEEGFMPADDGALHFHFDRKPFCYTAFIRALVLHWNAHRDEMLRVWEPRQPDDEFRGAFPDDVVAFLDAVDPRIPLDALRRQWNQSDWPQKTLDWNVSGLLAERPRRPTLEARFWNAKSTRPRIEEALIETEGYLTNLWHGAHELRPSEDNVTDLAIA